MVPQLGHQVRRQLIRQALVAAHMIVAAHVVVARAPDPDDRRAKLIRPIEAARPLIARIEAIALAVRRAAMGDLGERQIETIRAGLGRMRRALAEASVEA